MSNSGMTYPLFLVGMPRSGTKLLRGMLNQHSQLRFALIETEFFPFWVANWDRLGAMDGQKGFERFYRMCSRSPFFLQYSERGVSVDCQEWLHSCESYTPAAVFTALMRQVLSIPPGDDMTIWADKSPSYIRHVPLLLQHFPGAKVIHIVRDVRDCCLSARRAWGKNMLRTAQRWQDDVSRCREDGSKFPSSYVEVRYEDLLADPEATLRQLCTVVGITFEPEMLTPGNETENLGEAKGMDKVLTTNVRKYESLMSPSVEEGIEMIACNTLRALSYPCAYTGPPLRVPSWRLFYLQFRDGLSLFRRRTSQRGVLAGLRFLLEDFRVSGNRNR